MAYGTPKQGMPAPSPVRKKKKPVMTPKRGSGSTIPKPPKPTKMSY